MEYKGQKYAFSVISIIFIHQQVNDSWELLNVRWEGVRSYSSRRNRLGDATLLYWQLWR